MAEFRQGHRSWAVWLASYRRLKGALGVCFVFQKKAAVALSTWPLHLFSQHAGRESRHERAGLTPCLHTIASLSAWCQHTEEMPAQALPPCDQNHLKIESSVKGRGAEVCICPSHTDTMLTSHDHVQQGAGPASSHLFSLSPCWPNALRAHMRWAIIIVGHWIYVWQLSVSSVPQHCPDPQEGEMKQDSFLKTHHRKEVRVCIEQTSQMDDGKVR